jgi:prepilin-type N-terminal cleavage/methylation domain-containing protein
LNKIKLLRLLDSNNKHANGFTLAEILIAIAIIGILTSLAMPRFFKQYQRTCQAEAATKLNLLANSASAYKDIYGTAPTQWEQLSSISAVMTKTGTADNDDGELTNAIIVPSCDYEISRSSDKSGEEFIFNAVPTPKNGDKEVFNVMSCFDLKTGASDIKLGGKDVPGKAEASHLVCW